MRTCKKCGEAKPLDQFEVTNKERGWRRHECRDCVRERSRKYAKESKRVISEQEREQAVVRATNWAKANPDKRRKTSLAYYYRLQHAAIEAYGGYRCAWCGITEPLVLCIDHVNNDGREHRRQIGATGGHKFYKWLRDNGYPEGFQVLCMNCNHAKYRNDGVIPDTLKGRCND